jgi:hypothetical protein
VTLGANANRTAEDLMNDTSFMNATRAAIAAQVNVSEDDVTINSITKPAADESSLLAMGDSTDLGRRTKNGTGVDGGTDVGEFTVERVTPVNHTELDAVSSAALAGLKPRAAATDGPASRVNPPVNQTRQERLPRAAATGGPTSGASGGGDKLKVDFSVKVPEVGSAVGAQTEAEQIKAKINATESILL